MNSLRVSSVFFVLAVVVNSALALPWQQQQQQPMMSQHPSMMSQDPSLMSQHPSMMIPSSWMTPSDNVSNNNNIGANNNMDKNNNDDDMWMMDFSNQPKMLRKVILEKCLKKQIL